MPTSNLWMSRVNARLAWEIWVGDSYYPSLDAILANETITSGTIVAPPGTHTLDSSMDRALAAGLVLRVPIGGSIVVPDGRTLTINGFIRRDGPYDVFTLEGSGRVVFGTGAIDGYILKGTTGDPSWGYDSLICINAVDKGIKMYADGEWRTLVAPWAVSESASPSLSPSASPSRSLSVSPSSSPSASPSASPS